MSENQTQNTDKINVKFNINITDTPRSEPDSERLARWDNRHGWWTVAFIAFLIATVITYYLLWIKLCIIFFVLTIIAVCGNLYWLCKIQTHYGPRFPY